MRYLAEAIVCVAVLAWTLLAAPWANDLVGGDEGYYVTMARNLLADPRQWAMVSLSPLGAAGDKPPLVPALLAGIGVLSGFSAGALRLVPLASTALAMLAAVRLARRAGGEPAAIIAALLLATLPWLADSARVIAAEPTLAAAGLWALVLIADPALRTGRALVAGVLLGVAFLCKFWLVVLLAIPAAAALIGRPWRLWVAAGLGLALVGSSHLLVVLIATPDDLQHWWNVLFGFSLGSRASGGGFADYWLQPPTYYLDILARAMLLWLPFLAFGCVAAWRRRGEPLSRTLLAGGVSLALLSAFRVKSGVYLLPLVPLAAVVAAMGAAALIAMRSSQARAAVVRPLALALLALTAVAGAWRIVQRLPQRYHDPGYRDVAAFLAPHLAAAAPGDTVLIAPEAPAFQALLFRSVDYWDTPYRAWTPERAARLASGGGPQWFVLDTSRRFYGGCPDSASVAWLEGTMHEVTDEIVRPDGLPLQVRVFTRAPASRARLGAARAVR